MSPRTPIRGRQSSLGPMAWQVSYGGLGPSLCHLIASGNRRDVPRICPNLCHCRPTSMERMGILLSTFEQ